MVCGFHHVEHCATVDKASIVLVDRHLLELDPALLLHGILLKVISVSEDDRVSSKCSHEGLKRCGPDCGVQQDVYLL